MSAGDLTTLASVREFLRIPDAQTDMNGVLQSFITQASKAIHRYTGREFAPLSTAPQTRIFEYYGRGYLYFTPYDLQSASLVRIDTDGDTPTTLEADNDYFLKPRNTPLGVYEYMELRSLEPPIKTSSRPFKPWRQITITGTWGFPSVPEDVKAAANMMIAFWYRNQSALPGRDLGSEGDRFGPVNMPTAVMQLLAPYRVIGFGYGA